MYLIRRYSLILIALLLSACTPTAKDSSVVVQLDTAVDIVLVATDTDTNNFTYDYSQPANGSLSGEAPNLVYQPNPGFLGLDSFGFTASHGDQVSKEATVKIMVEEAIPIWGTLQGNANHDGYVPVTIDASELDLRWQVSLETADYSDVVVGNGRVYLNQNKTLLALNNRNGQIDWQHEFNPAVYSVNPPAFYQNSVYVQVGKDCSSCADKPFLYALDSQNGNTQFRSLYGAQWEQYLAPTPYDSSIYVNAGTYGGAQAFDSELGTSQWFTGLAQFDNWTPAVSETYLVGYTYGVLNVLNRTTGELLFNIPDPEFDWHGYDVGYAPVLAGLERVLVVEDGRLMNFNLSSQAIEWQLDNQYAKQPAYSNDIVYAVSSGSVHAINLADGSIAWEWTGADAITNNLIVTKNILFSASASVTYAIDLETSEVVWSYPVGGRLVLGDDSTLYILSSDDELVAINIEGDDDNDGLPNWWERANGLDPYFTNDSGGDEDEDGVVNTYEFQSSTNPNNADTDTDGLTDSQELNTYFSNPNDYDTDKDGMPDGWEAAYSLNVLSSLDAAIDTDLDTVTNIDEYRMGTDPTNIASVPSILKTLLESFESGELSQSWENHGLTDWGLTQTDASEGLYSISGDSESEVSWSGFFSGNVLRFDVKGACSSGSFTYSIDDDARSSYLSTSWTTVETKVARGFHKITFKHDLRCNVLVDNIRLSVIPPLYSNTSSYAAIYEEFLRVYSNSGELLQEEAVPDAGGCCDYARDLVVLDDGRIIIYNGTFSPMLSIYDPVTHIWTSMRHSGWGTVNNGTYGGIAVLGNYVYVTDMTLATSNTAGIVRFDLNTMSSEFFSGGEYIDLTIGLDGNLYALTGYGSLAVINPETMEQIEARPIVTSRSIAVDANGNVYAATWGGEIYRYDADNNNTGILTVTGSLYDIDISIHGELIISDRSGRIVRTDINLVGYTVVAETNAADFLTFISESLVSDSVIDNVGVSSGFRASKMNAASRVDADGADENGFYSHEETTKYAVERPIK